MTKRVLIRHIARRLDIDDIDGERVSHVFYNHIIIFTTNKQCKILP